MEEYVSLMNDGIRTLVKDAIRICLRKPKQIGFYRRFLLQSVKAQALREEQERAGLHVPPFLIASITSNCNLFCAGCYARANGSCGTRDGAQMGREGWQRVFDQAQQMGVGFILLAGGEPLLRLDVLEAAAGHADILFPVFTNGTLLGDGQADFFDAHRNLLPVLSVEGGRQATDSRRGEGVYDCLTSAMERLKNRSILFGVSVTVTKENIVEVTTDSFVQGLKRRGCSLLFYVEYVPADGNTDTAPGDSERAYLAKRAEELKKKGDLLILSFPGDEKETGGCLAAGRGFVHINCDGRVEPCPFSPYSDVSVADVSLTEALQSRFLQGMRQGGFLLGEHKGGCLLFERRDEVERMLQAAQEAQSTQ